MLEATLPKDLVAGGIVYRLSVQAEVLLEVWLELFKIPSHSDDNFHWEIASFGRSRQSKSKPWQFFRSIQKITKEMLFVDYTLDTPSTWTTISREKDTYLFSDGKHVISRLPIEPANFFLESNNFAAMSALFFIISNSHWKESRLKVLP